MKKCITALLLFIMMAVFPLWAWIKGDRVLGRWHDGMWYPARIVEVKENKFALAFDDGDVSIASEDDIRTVDWTVGTSVQCDWKNGGVYYWGRITQMKGELIHIEYNDGDHEDATIGRCRSL